MKLSMRAKYKKINNDMSFLNIFEALKFKTLNIAKSITKLHHQ
jgi:hypothetical protein